MLKNYLKTQNLNLKNKNSLVGYFDKRFCQVESRLSWHVDKRLGQVERHQYNIVTHPQAHLLYTSAF
jgi:hypothetical protein